CARGTTMITTDGAGFAYW
nr:immunoglobulin heavy chain junction region [Mus musculus]MBK4188057.1 immunoglobulin heavy chain junction region [Mus musculus]